MFVRWKRRKLKRDDQPLWFNSEGEEVEPRPFGPNNESLDVFGGTSSKTRKTHIRNIAWRRSLRAKGIDPSEILTRPAPDVYTLDAVLVESYRDQGKPRQRHVAHLGTIREDDIGADDSRWRVQFWRTVDTRLLELAIRDQDRATFEQAIAKRVPRPTDQEREAELERAASEARLLRSLGA